METFLRIVTTALICMIAEVVLSSIVPKLRKKEAEEKQAARQEKKVYLSGMLKKTWTALMAFVALVGILLVIFPQICEWYGFDYKVTLLVWWIPLVLDIAVVSRLLVEFQYDEEGFEYKNAFGFTRSFRYEDIVEVTERKGSVRIITASKKIRFGKGLCGADRFVACLKEKSSRSKK